MPFAPQLQELDPDSYEGKWLLQEWAYCSTGRSHLNLGPNSVVTPSQMIPTKPTIQLQVQQSSYKMYHHKHGDLMHIFYLMLLQVRSSTQVLQAKCKVLARQCSLWRLQERICFLDFSQLLEVPHILWLTAPFLCLQRQYHCIPLTVLPGSLLPPTTASKSSPLLKTHDA